MSITAINYINKKNRAVSDFGKGNRLIWRLIALCIGKNITQAAAHNWRVAHESFFED